MKKATKYVLKYLGEGEANVRTLNDWNQQKMYVGKGDTFEVTEKIFRTYSKYKNVYEIIEGPEGRKPVQFPKPETTDEVEEMPEEVNDEIDQDTTEEVEVEEIAEIPAESIVEEVKPVKKKKKK